MDVLAATSADVHALLSQRASGPLSGRREKTARLLREFVDANEDARASPNLRDERVDELGGITALMTDTDLPGDQDLALLALRRSRSCPGRRTTAGGSAVSCAARWSVWR